MYVRPNVVCLFNPSLPLVSWVFDTLLPSSCTYGDGPPGSCEWAHLGMRSCMVGVGGVNPIGDRDIISEKTRRKKASTQVWRGGSPVLSRLGRGLLDCRVTQLPITLSPLLQNEQLRCPQLAIQNSTLLQVPPK